jgi:hypothetical protein
MVQELGDFVKHDLSIDHRIHSRLIGRRGRTIRQVQSIVFKYPTISYLTFEFPRRSWINTRKGFASRQNAFDSRYIVAQNSPFFQNYHMDLREPVLGDGSFSMVCRRCVQKFTN